MQVNSIGVMNSNRTQKMAFGNSIRTAALAVGMGVATMGCDKGNDIPTPIQPPTPPIVKTLTPLEQEFNGAAVKYLTGVDVPSGSVLDSALVGTTGGEKMSWKVDAAKSSKDTLVVKTSSLNSSNVPQSYGVNKFFKDANGVLSSKNYYSRNFKYDDPKQVLGSIVQYAKEGDAYVASVKTVGSNVPPEVFKYSPLGIGQVLRTEMRATNIKSVLTTLFSLSIKR